MSYVGHKGLSFRVYGPAVSNRLRTSWADFAALNIAISRKVLTLGSIFSARQGGVRACQTRQHVPVSKVSLPVSLFTNPQTPLVQKPK